MKEEGEGKKELYCIEIVNAGGSTEGDVVPLASALSL
jgi:hypothetical protein